MSGSNKHILVPQLRFPEFRDAEEWTTYNLGQLSKIVTERVGDNDCIPYTITSGVGLISQQEKLGRTIAGNSLKNYILLQHNDFAYNKSATKAYPQGYIACYLGHERAAVPNSIFTCFRPTPNLVIPAFLNNLFVANLHGKWLKNRVAVGARANGALQVNNNDLMNVPVPLPTGSQSLSEQKKIADCLSSLDDLLTAEVQKLNVLKEYKKGLLQQLFPREGETVPQKRFPEFRGTVSTLPLETVADFVSEKISINKITPAHYVSTENLLSDFGGINLATKLPSVSSVTSFRPKDILVSNIRPYLRKVWQANVCGGASNDVLVIRPTERVGSNYLAVVLRSNFFIDYVMRGAKGVKMPRGEISMIRQFPVPTPCSVEQQKIADCLSSLDDLITAQSHKIDALKNHKRGLIQQLFPVLNEVPA
ncbi:restriction endonuclease subunit S [Escherichia coli]|nr:restriction endonuclease subunit S [Escherichia coli]